MSKLFDAVPIIVTHHAKARYVQRTLRKYENNDEAASKYVDENAKGLSISIIELIRSGEEDRSFTNDSQFMDYLWGKYGDVKFSFVTNGRTMFILSEKPSGQKKVMIVRTVVDSNSPPQDFYRKNNRRLISRGIDPLRNRKEPTKETS